MLESVSEPYKIRTDKESILPIVFALQTLLSIGWIAFYPFTGYAILFLWFVIFFLYKFRPLNLLIYGFLVSIIVLFYLFPRTYGSGNTAWHLSLLVFAQLFFLNRSLLSQIFSVFIKYLLFLCIASLVFRCLVFFGLQIPFRFIDLDPQFFNLYWPFYTERLFVSGEIEASLLGNFRFHGPFFEPGALGIALGVSLYGNLSRQQLLLIIFFGVLSLSMAFFFIGFFRLLEHTILKRDYKAIFVTTIAFFITIFFLFDREGYLYAQSVGRFMGTNDKILNNRVSLVEFQQMILFYETFSNNLWGSIVGIGWNVPGSGGSFRVWLLGSGVFGLILWICSYVSLLFKLVTIDFSSVLFRVPVLAILLYIWGNWMSLILLFLWYKSDKSEV